MNSNMEKGDEGKAGDALHQAVLFLEMVPAWPADDRQGLNYHALAHARELRAIESSAHKIAPVLIDVAQLLDGWHQDGTAWTEWDEAVRRRVSDALETRIGDAFAERGGNQPLSDLRGDPGAPRTVNAPARDNASSSLAHPEQGWQPIGEDYEKFADRLWYRWQALKFSNPTWSDETAYFRAVSYELNDMQKPLPLPPSPTDSEKK